MGKCGWSQPAAGDPPLGNHGLCPYFYNFAFTNDFVYDNDYWCWSFNKVINPPKNVKMGYLANFTR